MQSQILGLINPAIAFLFAGTFLLLWMRDRSMTYVCWLSLGYAGLACGFLLFHFAGDPDGPVSILAMHTAYSISVLAVCTGVLMRAGVAMRWPVPLFIVCVAGVLMVMSAPLPAMNTRLYIANTCYGLMFALAAQVLSRSGRGETIDRLILWLFGLTAAQFFIRPYLASVAEGAMTGLEYRSSVFYSVLILTVALISLVMAMVLVAATVSDQIRQMKEETECDLLTGLMGRRAFERAAMGMLDQAQGSERALSLIVADIDHFKRVNDIWGHQAGDNAITAFGRLLADTVRDGDLVGRIGGEEFCIIAWDCPAHAAKSLAERIRNDFSRTQIDGLGEDIRLTASFGVAGRKEGEGYGRIFARADAALYKAKESGRDRVEGPAPVSWKAPGRAAIRAA